IAVRGLMRDCARDRQTKGFDDAGGGPSTSIAQPGAAALPHESTALRPPTPLKRAWVLGPKFRRYKSMEFVTRFVTEDEGQDVVEYGLLIATIAIVVLVATAAFGSSIQAWFNRLAGRITTTAT